MGSEGGLAEGDIFIEPEACEQGYGEDDAECGDVGGYAKDRFAQSRKTASLKDKRRKGRDID